MTKEETMIRRFKNHCDIHGYPSKSFKKAVSRYIKHKNETIGLNWWKNLDDEIKIHLTFKYFPLYTHLHLSIDQRIFIYKKETK